MSRRFRHRIGLSSAIRFSLVCAMTMTVASAPATEPAKGENALQSERVRAAAEAARLQELDNQILAGRPSGIAKAGNAPISGMGRHPVIDAIHSGRIDGDAPPPEVRSAEEEPAATALIEPLDMIDPGDVNGFDPAEEDWSFLQPKKKEGEAAPVRAAAAPRPSSDPMIDRLTTATASAHAEAPASAYGDAAEATHGEAAHHEDAPSHNAAHGEQPAEHGADSIDHGEAADDEPQADGSKAAHGAEHEPVDHAEAGHGYATEGEAGHDEASHGETGHGEDGEHTGTPAEWETTRSPMPYEIVRSLQFLQDQVARGNKAAIRVQARLLKWFGPSLVRRSPEIWEDRRNVRAAALFVLSGGPPSVLRDLIARGVFKDPDMPLLEGSLAYAENKLELALEKLSRIDLSREETVFAAQVNLALAQLLQEKQPAESLKRLEAVMLAAPGTLLDEAALRLGVLLAEDLGETQKADLYARQYFDRYAASVYAGNFRARFSAVYSMRPAGTEIDTIETLRNALRLLPPEEQLALYLSVGRRALVLGNLKLAAMASARALTFGEASPEDRQRALLYSVASTLSERDEGELRAMLASIEDQRLHQADLALKRAVFDVVNAIRAPVDMAEADEAGEPVVDNKVLARANSLLQAVRNDLETLDQ